MNSIIGLIVVVVAVLGGFALEGGHMAVLIQPAELVIIGGAALGSVIVSAPGSSMKAIRSAFARGFKDSSPTKQHYIDLFSLLFELFQLMRREGTLAVENHVTSGGDTPLFQKYPSIKAKHHAFDMLLDGLKQMVDGLPPHELDRLFDLELETHHEEDHVPVNLIRVAGDSLPGLGIVAAVLGIVITMGHIDGGPEAIGHSVAAALVGTFLGILLCYGFVGPLATNIELQGQADSRYLNAIRGALVAAARGSSPYVAIDYGRRAVYHAERPTMVELEAVFQNLKGK